MKDALALAVDVALDAALTRRGGVRRLGLLPPSPLPRLQKLAGPDAALGRLGGGFLVNIIEGVPTIGQRPAIHDHPFFQVLTGQGTPCHHPLVTAAA